MTHDPSLDVQGTEPAASSAGQSQRPSPVPGRPTPDTGGIQPRSRGRHAASPTPAPPAQGAPATLPGPGTRLTVAAGSRTHVGCVREHNEDALLAASPVFLVADGMGGHEAGAEASHAALTAFTALVGQEYVSAPELDGALIHAAIDVDSLGSGASAPGSTLSGLVLSRQDDVPCVRVVNIGDSRTYCWRDQQLRQITHDHSEVQAQVDAGLLTAEQARASEGRNVITRALGAGVGPAVRADQTLLPVAAGDRFLVCSDGLSSLVPDAQLAQLLHRFPHPQQAADELVAAALRAGGRDNVSVIVVDVLTASPAPTLAPSLEQTIPTRRRALSDDATVPRAVLATDQAEAQS